ncbi:MAG: hypothetical protein ILA06_09930 [Bacteroidaceae bacterium]|nr:hypothetical protein [Bacteroidaceae bacterium]
MNKRSFIILPLFVPIFFSCRPDFSVITALERADSLCLIKPKAAVSMLDSLESIVYGRDEKILRWWQLLTIKARDKADLPLTTDSIIRKVVVYFDDKGPAKKKVEAHYYLGRTYVEIHDRPRAVSEFLKVIDDSENSGIPNPPIMANACSQLAGIYLMQRNPEAALEVVKKGYKVAQDSGFMDPIYVMDVATCYKRCGDMHSAWEYYQKALNMIQTENKVAEYSVLLTEILYSYATRGNLEKAEECLKLLESLPVEKRPSNYALGKACFFEFFGSVDSAIYYRKINLQDSTNYIKKSDTSRALLNLFSKKGDLEEAVHYAFLYAEANDSLRAQLRVEQTRDANNEYQYRRDMEAEAKAYLEASEARFDRTIAIGTAVIVLLFITALYLYRMRVAEQRLRSREQVILQHIEAIRQRDADIRIKEATISEKELEVERLIRHLLSSTAKEQSPDIISHFLNIAAGRERIKNEREWDELATAIESLYPQFITRVHERWALIKADELQIVCLMKIGLDTPQVMNVTELPKTTVYRKVRKAKAMLGDLLMD